MQTGKEERRNASKSAAAWKMARRRPKVKLAIIWNLNCPARRTDARISGSIYLVLLVQGGPLGAEKKDTGRAVSERWTQVGEEREPVEN